jgi:ribokinase/sulfofructose kinase
VCLGGITVDRIYHLSNLPRPGDGAHIVAVEKKGGGVEANVAAALAQLDVPVGLISRVGDDADGQWARDDLKAWGVDTSHVLTLPDVSTDYCQVWVAPDGERILACATPALRAMQAKEADWVYLRQAQILFLSSFVPFELARQAIQVAHQAHLTVALDLTASFDDLAGRGLSRESFWRLVPQIDLLMSTHIGICSLLRLAQAQQAFARFRQRAPQVALAMSMGTEGAWLSQEGQQVQVDAFQVQAVDTTGAGDAFHAGLIYGLLLQRWPLRRAGRFASALAALNCTQVGARGGLATRNQVEQFLSASSPQP